MKCIATVECGYVRNPVSAVGELVKGERAVLYLHGSNTSIERQEIAAEMLHEATQLPIILPEYSGHGANDAATYEEAMPGMHCVEMMAVYDWLCGEIGEENIIVYGTSYGATIAAALMRWRAPKQVILFAPAVVAFEDFFTARQDKPGLRYDVNRLTKAEAVQNVIDWTGGKKTRLTVLKVADDEAVDEHVVDAWMEVYPEAGMIVLEEARHSIRVSSDQGREEWCRGMVSAINLIDTPTDLDPEMREYLDAEYFRTLENLDVRNPKLLVVFAGGNGVGKSTLAEKIARELRGLWIENDAMRRAIMRKRRESMWSPELGRLLWNYAVDLFARLETLTPNGLIVRDAVVMGSYEKVLPWFLARGYELFVVGYDLSDDKMRELIVARGDTEIITVDGQLNLMEANRKNRERFFAEYAADIVLTDETVFDHDVVVEVIRGKLKRMREGR